MIILSLLNVVYYLLDVLLVFKLPSYPDSVLSVITTVVDAFESGISILSTFIGPAAMGVIAVLFTLALAMNAAYALYSLVFWVLRKVPMLGVDE